MKLIIRLVVLILVALFIFTGGFWLGKQWKGDADGDPMGNLEQQFSGNEVASTDKKAATPEASPKTPPEDSLEKLPAESLNEPGPSEIADKPPVPQTQGEQAPSAEAPPATQKVDTPKPDSPQAPENKQVAEAAPPPKTDPAIQEKSASPPAQPPPPPEPEKEPGPAESKPEGENKKESLALIVTPEDLGANLITYSVQAGTFLEKDLAQIRLSQLKAKKYPAFMVNAWDDKKQLWYTVRIGRFTDILQAQMAAKELTMKERIPATVYGIGSLGYDESMESAEGAEQTTQPVQAGKAAPSATEASK